MTQVQQLETQATKQLQSNALFIAFLTRNNTDPCTVPFFFNNNNYLFIILTGSPLPQHFNYFFLFYFLLM